MLKIEVLKGTRNIQMELHINRRTQSVKRTPTAENTPVSAYEHDYGQDFSHNYGLSSKWQKFLPRAIIAFGLCGAALSGITYYNYRKSLDWSTNRDSLKMADMPADVLTDTPAQAKVKQNFLVLANKALAKNGELNVNYHQLVKLRQTLNRIKTAKPIYQKRYDQIKKRYVIRQKLANLFAKKGVLKKSVTTKTVYKVLADVSPELDSLYIKNNHDVFVKQEAKIAHKLTSDANRISKTIVKLNQVLPSANGKIIPVASLTPNSYDPIFDRFDHLHYEWPYLDHFKDMQDELHDVLQAQQDKIDRYNEWQNDLKDEQKAYRDLATARRKHRESYLEEKAKKEREKQEELKRAQEEKQREEQEAEQERQSEAEERKQENSNHSSSSSTSSDSENRSKNNSSSQAPVKQKPTTKTKPKHKKEDKNSVAVNNENASDDEDSDDTDKNDE